MAKIKFTLPLENGGSILSEINGIKGPKCAKVDGFLETLGEVKFSKTSEFYDNEQPGDVMITKHGQ